VNCQARVIIWDFDNHTIVSQHELHKVRVEAVSFSSNDNYLFSIGGRDCGSLVVWDVTQGQVICGSAVAHGIQGEATTILSMNRRGPCFMTGGDNHLAVWTVDKDARKVQSLDVSTGKLKRTILCMDANERDELCYCGTATGDVLKIRLNYHHDPDVLAPAKHPMTVGCFTRISNKRLPMGRVDLYSMGVRSIRRLFAGPLLIGAGNGVIELVEETKSTGAQAKIPSVPTLRVVIPSHRFRLFADWSVSAEKYQRVRIGDVAATHEERHSVPRGHHQQRDLLGKHGHIRNRTPRNLSYFHDLRHRFPLVSLSARTGSQLETQSFQQLFRSVRNCQQERRASLVFENSPRAAPHRSAQF
jgi:hypothetical protein